MLTVAVATSVIAVIMAVVVVVEAVVAAVVVDVVVVEFSNVANAVAADAMAVAHVVKENEALRRFASGLVNKIKLFQLKNSCDFCCSDCLI